MVDLMMEQLEQGFEATGSTNRRWLDYRNIYSLVLGKLCEWCLSRS
jgi:hypothetical protein